MRPPRVERCAFCGAFEAGVRCEECGNDLFYREYAEAPARTRTPHGKQGGVAPIIVLRWP